MIEIVRPKKIWVNKYTPEDGRLIESVIVEGQPYIIQMQEGSELGKDSILLTFASLGYRAFLATGVSGPNVFTYLGTAEACQGTIVEDELDNLDNDRDKMNIWKSGYSLGTSRIPKIDLNPSGREQHVFHSYCFKIGASESSLDNSKAKGLLDRCFVIPCG